MMLFGSKPTALLLCAVLYTSSLSCAFSFQNLHSKKRGQLVKTYWTRYGDAIRSDPLGGDGDERRQLVTARSDPLGAGFTQDIRPFPNRGTPPIQPNAPPASRPAATIATQRAVRDAMKVKKTPTSARTTPPPDSIDEKTIWDTDAPVTIQGGNTLRTFDISSYKIERVQVLMKTDGRPLNAEYELWHGPDNVPQKFRVYVDDGQVRPFSAVIETPGAHNTVALRNTSPIEFPFTAVVEADINDDPSPGGPPMGPPGTPPMGPEGGRARYMQGGSVYTAPFDTRVSSVQILLKTDGRPLSARIEVIQGPNNSKQVIEVYTEDGLYRPFYFVVETPGAGNVVRIVNTATMEFPLIASVEPYMIEDGVRGPAFTVDSPW